jgi:hypothetical protein
MLNGTKNKPQGATNSLINQSYMSSNSFNKSIHKEHSYIGHEKHKKELKLSSLNEKLYLINEFKKGNFNKDPTSSTTFKDTLAGTRKTISRQNMKTKLIPREKFMNSSLVSSEFKILANTTKENMISNNNTENACLDNDLELLDYKSFESTSKKETYVDPKLKYANTYNSDILNLLTKKHMSVSSSPKNRFNIKMNNLYVTDLTSEGQAGFKTNYISYSKNVSIPKTSHLAGSTSYTDFQHKMNTSNITLESEKSFNNNIMFTDGGITNINIHGILSCEEVPNEIYFNDRRYKAIQESLNNTLQENLQNSQVIKELKATVDILKCYIDLQKVKD